MFDSIFEFIKFFLGCIAFTLGLIMTIIIVILLIVFALDITGIINPDDWKELEKKSKTRYVYIVKE